MGREGGGREGEKTVLIHSNHTYSHSVLGESTGLI